MESLRNIEMESDEASTNKQWASNNENEVEDWAYFREVEGKNNGKTDNQTMGTDAKNPGWQVEVPWKTILFC